MSEEAFLECLGEQAQTEIARLLGEAEDRARVLLEEAEKAAAREEEDIIRDAGIQAGVLRSRILNEARAEARKIVLEAAHRLATETLDEVAALAESRVGAKEGPALLEALVSECLIEENCRLCCRPEDTKALKEITRRMGLQVTIEERPLSSRGVVVVSDDGLFVQSNTVGDRLRKARPTMMQAIAERLGDLTGKGISRA